ncbi:MAG TPA: serine protease, partial [Anaerolineales bacterium]|nr:serine protease [Anaerolineales bacterium]
MTQPEASILRVLKNNSVVGAAFLVAKEIAVTCAHIVKAAGKTKGDSIILRLANGESTTAIVDPDLWRHVNAEDIAILRLEESISGISPLVLGSSEGTKGHTFSTFGFPQSTQELTGRGEIVGYASLNGIKHIQLRSEQVTPGFSGAPVFDENTQRVVGMIVAITPPDEYKRQGTTAFAIPAEIMREICPELQVSDICPYVGLDTFTDETAEFFFGRDALTEKLLKVLRGGCRFLAVFGPSGSGKSSVVRAGLLPALKKGQVPGSQKWAQITMPRADNPFEQMREAGLNSIDINQYLEFHPEFERVVLFIDQFEELFTVCPDDIRNQLVHDLMSALENSRLILILSMRDDFYSAFNAKAVSLAGSTHKMVVDVSATLELTELMAIIERPAAKVGLTLEEGLTERIIEDLTRNGEAPSSTLPLLEFALTQLWERRRDGILTHDSYQEIDGVTGSLTRWADDAFSHLTKEDQTLAEGLLTSLVHLGDEAQGLPDTRRRRSLAEFEEPTRRVIKYFADLRLLVTSSETAELIHDTLLREWGRLKNWLDENRNFLTWRQKLVERYREWKENRGELLRGRELAVAQDFWSKRRADLDEPTESQKLEEYISSSGKQVRQTRWLIITSVVFAFLILAAFGAIAWEQRNNALSSQLTSTAGLAAQIEAIANEKKALQTSQAESTRVANAQATAQANATLASLNEQQASHQEILKISQKLSNDAKSNIGRDYRLGLLLGVESVRLNNLPQDNALPPLLDKMPPGLIRTLDLFSGPVRKIMYTPNGNLMVTMSDTVNLWNTE